MKFNPAGSFCRLFPTCLIAGLALMIFSPAGFGQSHWAVKPSNASASLNAVVFGNGLFVAVGDSGIIVTSPDGEVWTPRVSGTTDRLPAITFGNGRFVVTRENQSAPILTSLDGITWAPGAVTNSDGTPRETSAFATVAFGGGRFMAAGPLSSAVVLISTDGIAFHPVTVAPYPNSLGGPIGSLTYFGGQFYAATGYSGIYSSADGMKWKPRGDWGNGSSTVTQAIGTDGISKISVVGSTSYPTFSVDAGHIFQHANHPVDPYHSATYSFRAICYGAGQFVGVDAAGGTWTSERGDYWLPRERYGNAGEELRSVAFDGLSHFVSVGSAPPGGTALIIAANADPPAPSPPGYTVTSLKDYFDEVRFVANSGAISGSITVNPSKKMAAVLRDGVVTTYPDADHTNQVTGVNAAGLTTVEALFGVQTEFTHVRWPYVYPAGTKLSLDPSGYATAAGVNSDGAVGGTYLSFSPSYHKGLYRFETSTGQMTDLGDFGKSDFSVVGISDRAELAGTVLQNRHTSAYLVSPEGAMTVIPTLGGDDAHGLAVSSAGHVAGYSQMPLRPWSVFDVHAFVFKDNVLSDIDTFNSSLSIAESVNAKGDAVGRFEALEKLPGQATPNNSRAFLSTQGRMYDLNQLLDSSGDGWILNEGISINDSGWIVGQGSVHGVIKPFLAIPNNGKPAGIQSRFVNVSTRLRTGSGDDVLIGGFIVRGGPKRVVVRAIGPGIDASGGTPGLLPDPTLELFNDRGERLAFNDNFSDLPYFPDQNEIGRLGFGIFNYVDSVVLITLAEGNYTAVVRGKNGAAGNCLVEIYNVDTDFTPGLINISTRGPVGTGDNVMIAGFIIRGDRERRVLIRGSGPSLAALGVPNSLSDPTLEIHDANGQIAQNNDWRSDQEGEILATGLSPADNREAAVILSVWPGAYTAIVRGLNNSTGNALVEVYQLPE